MKRTPEPRHTIPGLASKLPLGAHIDRRVRPELEGEDLGVVSGVRSAGQLEQVCDPICLKTGRLRNASQGAEEFRQMLRPFFFGTGAAESGRR
jgi:hypothetical protein